MTEALKTRNYAIDLIKLVASFFVICIHTKTTISVDGFKTGSFSYIIDNVARFAVPFFFMASGYLLDFTDKKKIQSRLLKVILLYIFWSVIFIVIRESNGLSYASFSFSHNEKISFILSILYTTLFYGLERHMWFFPAYIVGVVMVMLIGNNKRVLMCFAAILYCIGLTGQEFRFIYPEHLSFIPMQSYDHEWLQRTYLTRNGFFLAFPCIAAGHMLKGISAKTMSLSLLLLGPIIISLFALQYMECYLMTMRTGEIAEYYVSTIFLSGFILLLGIKYHQKKTIFSHAGKQAGGVYLIHPVFMYIFIINFKDLTLWQGWPFIYTPLLFTLSLLSSLALSKLPFLRRVITI
jgi:surface polysaccharide O-acyltransferase-like enzyme